MRGARADILCLPAELKGGVSTAVAATLPEAAEIESCRPFVILREVATPGQDAHLCDMSVEIAVAIADSFSVRERRDRFILIPILDSGATSIVVPLGLAVSAGDTAVVSERST